jgi:hypothetical protein
MVFTVEDGTDVVDANAYAALATVDAYFADRNDADWTGDDTTVKQPAIIKATQYVDQRWGALLKGIRSNSNNELEFSRSYLYSKAGILITGIPTKLIWAVCEYSKIALTEDLFPTLVGNDQGGKITKIREDVGPIKTETAFSEGGPVSIIRILQVGDRWMADYVLSARRTIRG